MEHSTHKGLDIFTDRNPINGSVTVTVRDGSGVVYKQTFFDYTRKEIKALVLESLNRKQ